MNLRMPSPDQLEWVYENHLRVSFPPAELKPLQAIQTMWRDGCYRPWCLFNQQEQIIGEGFLWLGHPGWMLLDYLCVSPDYRNQGCGETIIRLLLEQEPDSILLAESEIPEFSPDRALAIRRLNFYARNHAKTAGYDSEMFGVPYKTLYWSPEIIPDERLITEHRFIYQNRFPPKKYTTFVRIPRESDAAPMSKVPWDESE